LVWCFLASLPEDELGTYVRFPDEDFVAASGYWFWHKSASAHGSDVKAFEQNYVYLPSTELVWTDDTTFKRFFNDLPLAARRVAADAAGPKFRQPIPASGTSRRAVRTNPAILELHSAI
jgi:hypothetical protein